MMQRINNKAWVKSRVISKSQATKQGDAKWECHDVIGWLAALDKTLINRRQWNDTACCFKRWKRSDNNWYNQLGLKKTVAG